VHVAVRVPATSANLGPGFDCFGLALDLCNEVVFDTAGRASVGWRGEGAGELPTDGSDLIQTSMRSVAGGRSLPRAAMRAHNEIPLARGLGSSSAAVVAAVAAALVFLDEEVTEMAVFERAAEIEGHPDNAAPACFGGFTIASPGGSVRVLRPHENLRPVVLVPTHLRLPTGEARAALSASVAREDAVYNVAHAALMVEAISRDPALLGEAMRDRLHERARLDLVPEARTVLEAVRAAGIPACVSGAGPSLLAFPPAGAEVPDPGGPWVVRPLGTRVRGFELDVR
jgi:homoserine kinase